MASLPSFAREYPNLASASLGGDVVGVSDDFFASASRMLGDSEPVFIADKYDNHGKWMDGWETRRSRDGHDDWCVVRLAANADVRGLLVSTRHFTGNYAPAACVDFCPDPVVDVAAGRHINWLPLLDKVRLAPDREHYFSADKFTLNPHSIRYLRLTIFPNGGVARFRVFGEAQDAPPVNRLGEMEVSSLLCGGRVVDWNNSHFGEPWVILKPCRARSMQDGWETRRRRDGGEFDWLLMRLPRRAVVRKVEVDTAFFKGNYPESCSLEAGDADIAPDKWRTLLARTPLGADKRHFFEDEVCDLPPVEMVRLRIYPDGGISRLRLFGDFVDGDSD